MRVSPGGVVVDGIDSYSRAISGEAPADFADLIKFARDVLPVVQEACGVEVQDVDLDTASEQQRADLMRVRDVLLLSAWVLTELSNEGKGQNPLAYVQRAKQVIEWCKPQREGQTLLEHLEAKGRELARLLAERLSRHENFLLVIQDCSPKGASSWISSMPRRETIEAFRGTLDNIAADQQARS